MYPRTMALVEVKRNLVDSLWLA